MYLLRRLTLVYKLFSGAVVNFVGSEGDLVRFVRPASTFNATFIDKPA